MINWNSIDIKKRNELDNNYWDQGYFHLNFGDKTNYKRDFEELRLRDISVFSLGELRIKKF